MCGFKLMNFKFERPFGFEFHGLFHIRPIAGVFFELIVMTIESLEKIQLAE